MIYAPHKMLYGNFRMSEVARSSTASRLGIDNTPSDKVLEIAEQLCINFLQPIRDHYGIPFSPSSWFRCEALEREVTKNSFSRWANDNGYNLVTLEDLEYAWSEYFRLKSHPKGEAVDFEIPGIDNHKLFDHIYEMKNIEFDQLISEFMKKEDPYAGWIHGSYSNGHNRNQVVYIK